jgi:hypothetical protein
MSHAIDFGELKQRVSIERAAGLLGIKLTKNGPQLRGPCPLCKAGGDRAFVITPAKGLYYCFGACGKGGDAITMAANHAHSVAIHTMHYNFVRIRQTLRCTPAKAAGVTTTLWELAEMVKALEACEASKDA